ncbi:MAG: cation diffusion facilitator family transporter [Candidatus Micrarchaeota archaeon]
MPKKAIRIKDEEKHIELETQRHLRITLAVSIVILIIQAIGFYLSNSLALLGDTFHLSSDIISVIVGMIALHFALKKHEDRRTFGFHRLEVFSALFNGLLLLLMGIFVAFEAIDRIKNPAPISPLPIVLAASLGLIGNLIMAWQLKNEENLNIQGIFLHILGDTLSSVGVLISAVVIYFTGLTIIDGVVSLLIAFIIGSSSYYIIRNSLSILLESAPKELQPEKVIKIIKRFKQVKDVHDVHIWSICSDIRYITAHIVMEDIRISKTKTLVEAINERLKKELFISHTTFQVENILCKNGICHTWHFKK